MPDIDLGGWGPASAREVTFDRVADLPRDLVRLGRRCGRLAVDALGGLLVVMAQRTCSAPVARGAVQTTWLDEGEGLRAFCGADWAIWKTAF